LACTSCIIASTTTSNSPSLQTASIPQINGG
jgi:hypothetical protein